MLGYLGVKFSEIDDHVLAGHNSENEYLEPFYIQKVCSSSYAFNDDAMLRKGVIYCNNLLKGFVLTSMSHVLTGIHKGPFAGKSALRGP